MLSIRFCLAIVIGNIQKRPNEEASRLYREAGQAWKDKFKRIRKRKIKLKNFISSNAIWIQIKILISLSKCQIMWNWQNYAKEVPEKPCLRILVICPVEGGKWWMFHWRTGKRLESERYTSGFHQFCHVLGEMNSSSHWIDSKSQRYRFPYTIISRWDCEEWGNEAIVSSYFDNSLSSSNPLEWLEIINERRQIRIYIFSASINAFLVYQYPIYHHLIRYRPWQRIFLTFDFQALQFLIDRSHFMEFVKAVYVNLFKTYSLYLYGSFTTDC